MEESKECLSVDDLELMHRRLQELATLLTVLYGGDVWNIGAAKRRFNVMKI